MKQMTRKITITYRWWRSDRKKAIKPAHVEALEETAEDRIQEMMGRGCREGELSDSIHMTHRDPADGVEYDGYWQVEKKDE